MKSLEEIFVTGYGCTACVPGGSSFPVRDLKRLLFGSSLCALAGIEFFPNEMIYMR